MSRRSVPRCKSVWSYSSRRALLVARGAPGRLGANVEVEDHVVSPCHRIEAVLRNPQPEGAIGGGANEQPGTGRVLRGLKAEMDQGVQRPFRAIGGVDLCQCELEVIGSHEDIDRVTVWRACKRLGLPLRRVPGKRE